MAFLYSNPANVTDSGGLELDGASSVVSADVGGVTYVFAAGADDNGISLFSLSRNGVLTNLTNFDDSDAAGAHLGGARGLSIGVVDGNTYLFVAGATEGGVSVFRVTVGGGLTNVANVVDAGALRLAGVTDTATVTVGGATYMFAAGANDDGISGFRVAGNGALTNVSNVTDADNAAYELDGVSSLATVTVGANSFLIAGGGIDDGVSVFQVSAAGALTHAGSVADNGTLNLNGVSDITTAVVNGTTYVFVAGAADFGRQRVLHEQRGRADQRQ